VASIGTCCDLLKKKFKSKALELKGNKCDKPFETTRENN